jgi:hypothetical protein
MAVGREALPVLKNYSERQSREIKWEEHDYHGHLNGIAAWPINDIKHRPYSETNNI